MAGRIENECPAAFANAAVSPPTIQICKPPYSSESCAPLLPAYPFTIQFAKKKNTTGGNDGRVTEEATSAFGRPPLRRSRLQHRLAVSGPPLHPLAAPANLHSFPFSLLHISSQTAWGKGDQRGPCCCPAPHLTW